MIPEFIIFRNREEWKDWLEQNHTSSKDIWIAIFKKKYSHKGITYDEALEEAICFGWIDSLMKRLDEEKFILRFSPRRRNSPWSLKNKNRAEKMLAEGKMTEAGIAMIDNAIKSGWWEMAYSMKRKQEIPPDMENALKENPRVWKRFKELNNSDQMRYIFWINTAKKQETRKKRIQDIIKKMSK